MDKTVPPSEREFLLRVLKANSQAISLCELLFAVSQTWDDLIDGDVEVTTDQVNDTFLRALVEIPANAFYQAHFASLHPLIQSAIYDWLASNELAKGNAHDKTLAFVLRDSLSALVTQCSAIIGGHQWAIQAAPMIRRQFHDEPLQQYIGEQK